MLNALTEHFTTHVQAAELSRRNLEKQVGKAVEAVQTLVQNSSKPLPAQTEVDPQVRNVNAVHLRSGRKLEGNFEAERMIEGDKTMGEF